MQNDRRFYVYVHRRKSDGSVFYVGKGKGGRYKRKQGRSEYWHRTANRHGWECEIVFPNLTEQCAFSIEKALISSIDGLVNLCTGGEGAAGIPKSEAWKAAASERFKGKNNPMYGRGQPLSEDHKRKIGDSNRKPKPEGFGEKISSILKGRRMTESQKAKLKGSRNVGADNPMYGTKRERSPNFDPTEFIFLHPNYGRVTSTSYDMPLNFDVRYDSIRLLARGKIKSTRQWICLGPSGDEDLPDQVLAETEKMRRMAA